MDNLDKTEDDEVFYGSVADDSSTLRKRPLSDDDEDFDKDDADPDPDEGSSSEVTSTSWTSLFSAFSPLYVVQYDLYPNNSEMLFLFTSRLWYVETHVRHHAHSIVIVKFLYFLTFSMFTVIFDHLFEAIPIRQEYNMIDWIFSLVHSDADDELMSLAA